MSSVRASPSTSSALASHLARKEKLEEELRNVEKQVYDLETTYLNDSSQCGNVLKGFDGFLSSNKTASNTKRPRKFMPEDRLFSLSSMTSPAVEESAVGRDGDGAGGGGRSKGGATTPANGPGKQKRARQGREGRRAKHPGEIEQEEEEDVDMLMR
ncbi:hypothetical protein CBR_g31961 [Chara braunii]|uniref:Chromatin modification-related protein MEAF6 n=1 Tax=Chara braunii TaxID=69332 RepID=A0A388LG46_CHABU|nr:hypothetical protein CBR_g31961 [Chara braunii]|eukprot:GBG81286.1 hypothetical protein CBR_g31961 [Chara braunii]